MRDLTVHEFVFRGLLAEEALDRSGRLRRELPRGLDAASVERLGLDLIDAEFVSAADRMAVVYTAIAAFENSARKLVSAVLLENVGEDWWDRSVSAKVIKKAEERRREEERVKWHAQRGAAPINYTDLSDLINIIRANWSVFEAFLPSVEWAGSIFDVIERSRNVIMHSGQLEPPDIERIGINIRDWIKQVGA